MSARYRADENKLLLEAIDLRLAPWVIAENLNKLRCNIERRLVRTAKGVGLRMLSVIKLQARGEFAPSIIPGDHGQTEAYIARRSDEAFQRVMAAAISNGVEHASIGVKKDDTPFVGKFIHAAPMFSGCSSSSAMCVEAAGIDPVGDSLLA